MRGRARSIRWSFTGALIGALVSIPPAVAAEPVPEQWRNPWLAAALPLLGPALWYASPPFTPISVLWPYASATGLVYAGEPLRALEFGLLGGTLSLASIGAALHGSCGRSLGPCTSFDAGPYVMGASLGLVGLMSYEGYVAVQRRRAGIWADDARGVPVALTMPLEAAAMSAFLPPAVFLAPLPMAALASPLGCGVGQAMAGDWARAGWVVLGGFAAGATGMAIGAQFPDPDGQAGQRLFTGGLWGLTAFSVWAGWDAYHAVRSSTVVRYPPPPLPGVEDIPGMQRDRGNRPSIE